MFSFFQAKEKIVEKAKILIKDKQQKAMISKKEPGLKDSRSEKVQIIVGAAIILIVTGILTVLIGFAIQLPISIAVQLPINLFIVLALLLTIFGLIPSQESKEKFEQLDCQNIESTTRNTPEKMFSLYGEDSLSIHIGQELLEQVENLMDSIGDLRLHLMRDLGFILPPVRVLDSKNIGSTEYQIFIRGLLVFSSKVYLDKYLISKSQWDLSFSNPPQNLIEEQDLFSGDSFYWLEKQNVEELKEEDCNLTCLCSVKVILHYLSNLAINNVEQLLTKADVKRILDLVERADSRLIPNLLSVSLLQKIMINLLRERCSIKDIQLIIEKLEDFARDSNDPDLLSERIRRCMSSKIQSKHIIENTVFTLELSPDLSNHLEESLELIEGKKELNIPSIEANLIIDKITESSMLVYKTKLVTPILVCKSSIRLPLARMIQKYSSKVITIFSCEELSPKIRKENLQIIS